MKYRLYLICTLVFVLGCDDKSPSQSDSSNRPESSDLLDRASETTVKDKIERLKEERENRYDIAHSFATVPDSERGIAITELNKLLSSEDWEVRQAAVLALGEVGELPDPIIERLIALSLNDEKSGVRHFAINVLGNIGQRASKAVPVLMEILAEDLDKLKTKDADAPVFPTEGELIGRPWQTITALGQIGPDAAGALPLLHSVLEETNVWFDTLKPVARKAVQQISAQSLQ